MDLKKLRSHTLDTSPNRRKIRRNADNRPLEEIIAPALLRNDRLYFLKLESRF
jgi:hypothetical protein